MEGEDSGEKPRDNKNMRRLVPAQAGMLPLDSQRKGKNPGGHHSIPCCYSTQGHANKDKNPPGHADFPSPKRNGREKMNISPEVQRLAPKMFSTLSLTCSRHPGLSLCWVNLWGQWQKCKYLFDFPPFASIGT